MVKQADIKTGARLPNDLNEKLEAWAKERGVSKNTIILLALHDYLKVC